MFQIVEDYGRDQIINGVDEPGWSQVVDITRAPTEALPWLAQFVGVTVPVGTSDAVARNLIQNVGGFSRGTAASILAAAQAYLTGTKSVTFTEREAGNPYLLGITVKTAEAPDVSKVLAAITAQKPAGIILDFSVTGTGQTYGAVYNAGATTYSTVFTTYANYQNLLLGITGNVPAGGTYGTGTYGSGAYGG
jgi:hypothetical protein